MPISTWPSALIRVKALFRGRFASRSRRKLPIASVRKDIVSSSGESIPRSRRATGRPRGHDRPAGHSARSAAEHDAKISARQRCCDGLPTQIPDGVATEQITTMSVTPIAHRCMPEWGCSSRHGRRPACTCWHPRLRTMGRSAQHATTVANIGLSRDEPDMRRVKVPQAPLFASSRESRDQGGNGSASRDDANSKLDAVDRGRSKDPRGYNRITWLAACPSTSCRAKARYPRLAVPVLPKTRMPGLRPGMTASYSRATVEAVIRRKPPSPSRSSPDRGPCPVPAMSAPRTLHARA